MIVLLILLLVMVMQADFYLSGLYIYLPESRYFKNEYQGILTF